MSDQSEATIADIFDTPKPIATDLPPDAVADLQQKPEPAPSPTPDPKPAPEPPAKPAEPKAEDPKPDPAKEPAPGPEGKPTRQPKASPIATLLATKHDLEEQLAAANTAKAELETKLADAAAKPASPEASADIKALAAKYKIDESILADIVSVARAGMNPELPPEVTSLLKERQAEKDLKAETDAFNARTDGLAKSLGDEQLSDPKVRDRLMKLAYSTDKAPDGEPYYKKELAEIYFAYIKPEIEPGKPSAEPSRGGTGGSKVVDFQAIQDRDDPKDIEGMDDATFEKYTAWQKEKAGNPPIKRAPQS